MKPFVAWQTGGRYRKWRDHSDAAMAPSCVKDLKPVYLIFNYVCVPLPPETEGDSTAVATFTT
jgi:hypothetical protein